MNKSLSWQVLFFASFVGIIVGPYINGTTGEVVSWIGTLLFALGVGMYIVAERKRRKAGKYAPDQIRAMDQRLYFIIASLVFLTIAIVHILRIWNSWEVVIAGWSMPTEFSILAVVISVDLAWMGLSFFRKASA